MAKQKNETSEKLKELGDKIVKDINKEKNPEIILPVRALSNVEYDRKTQTLKLGDKTATRSFFNVAHAKKFLQTVEIAKVSKDLLKEEKHASLRDVYYMVKRTLPDTKVNLVDEQTESDDIIEDLELITRLSREQLNMTANKMGSVVGRVTIEDRGDTIHWDKLGSGGYSIPSTVEEIKFKKVDAKYVLYMENAAVWERLNEDRYWEKNNCLIVSSQGQTTRGIRRLLQRLHLEHKLPIYVLCDNDPYGYWIFFVIKHGSINLAAQAEKLAIPGAKYLGITCDDVLKYDLKKHFIQLKETDISRLKQISEYEWVKDNKEWQKQFKMMKDFGAKVEIQSLSSKGISFISERYLVDKIKNKEFLE